MQVVETPSSTRPPFRVDSPTLGSEIKVYMERHRATVGELIESGDERAGALASQKWTRAFDGLLCAIFCALRSTTGDEKTWRSISLAAVGSFGRGNFGYRSDLDVRILCSRPQKAEEIAEALLYPLWDAGLEIGHQVITIGDTISLAKRDLPTATTLLDWRHIAGDAEQGMRLQEKAYDAVFSPRNIVKFLQELGEQAQKRWDRFGDSVYLLEPDVKNGQGGLRDLDIVHWAAQARWRIKGLDELVPLKVLTKSEYEKISDAAAFVGRVRNILHFKSPRRTERLSFESQEVVADTMGYGRGGAACEAMMSDYYRHARNLSNAREAMLFRAEPPSRKKVKVRELDGGVILRGETVALPQPNLVGEEPVLALRAYWEAVHRELPVDPATRDAIARAMSSEDVCERLRQDEEAATLFRRVIRKPRKVQFKRNSILSEFHDVGILLAMIPEFRPVVGRVHHDIYHVYTVDTHSIKAVDRLRELCRGDLFDEFPLASRLAADVARPQVLYMATLLHDIGKDTGGRNHGERGAQLARPILERLGVQEHDIIEIQHLVRKHLRMYHVASRRDIDDPQTIKDFCQEVHGPEGLKELYLLTLSDVATTSPTALTSWKARMMQELYMHTLASFDETTEHTEARAGTIRRATRVLAQDEGESGFVAHFLDSVPNRYLYANEPEQIISHAHLAREAEQGKNVVEVLGVRAPYVEVAFITEDRPGALATITASLAANKLRVIGAQLYSWTDRTGVRRVLDIFWLRGGRDPEQVKKSLPRLRQDLEKLIAGEIAADELINGRQSSRLSQRPSPNVPVVINFDNRSSTSYTVIEVLAEDSRALLFRLAKTLSETGLEIAVAKINTEGNSVADVFYVADREGKKLTDANQVEHLSNRIRAALPKPN